MIEQLKQLVPVGSPLWKIYRSVRLRSTELAPGYVLHGNILLEPVEAMYFYVPKVACSSVKAVCAECLGWGTGQRDLAETIHQLKFPYAKRHKIRSRYADYYKFAFVRNPWDRVWSCYQDKIGNGADQVYDRHENRFVEYLKTRGVYRPDLTFEDFVEVIATIPDEEAEGHLRSQTSFLSDRHGMLPLDKVGRFENLAEDFAVVAERLGLDNPLPHLRRTGERRYRDHYSAKMKELVRTRYEGDVTRFSYDF